MTTRALLICRPSLVTVTTLPPHDGLTATESCGVAALLLSDAGWLVEFMVRLRVRLTPLLPAPSVQSTLQVRLPLETEVVILAGVPFCAVTTRRLALSMSSVQDMDWASASVAVKLNVTEEVLKVALSAGEFRATAGAAVSTSKVLVWLVPVLFAMSVHCMFHRWLPAAMPLTVKVVAGPVGVVALVMLSVPSR
jgi:hypothetical protein